MRVARTSLLRHTGAVWFGALLTASNLSVACAEPVRIYAAGSLVAALKDVIAVSGLPADAVAAPVFGPAGLLRQRIEGGEIVDLFLSADLAGPRRLAETGIAKAVVPFARNQLCLLARADLNLTPDTLLDAVLRPDVRLATSTPGADPGGDYAEAVFEKAEAVQPGAKSVLDKKALRLLGSPNTMVPIAGRSPSATVFFGKNADALLYYCSGQSGAMKEAPGLTLIQLPAALSVPAVYRHGDPRQQPRHLAPRAFSGLREGAGDPRSTRAAAD